MTLPIYVGGIVSRYRGFRSIFPRHVPLAGGKTTFCDRSSQNTVAAAMAAEEEATIPPEEEDPIRVAAETELTFSLPGLFSKADPERMRLAIAAAKSAGVAEATVANAEGKMARVLQREEEERLRLVALKEKDDAEAAAKLEAEAKAAEEKARALACEQTPQAKNLRRVSALGLAEINADDLEEAVVQARRAGVSTEAVNEGVTKVAQARRWSAASDALAVATAPPTTDVSAEVKMYRLRKSVVEARAVGLPLVEVEVAETQLTRMEAVVEVKRGAERELAFSLPGFFSKAEPERMRAAIGVARSAGVAEATVADAEDKMARVLQREEEERKRQAKEQKRREADAAVAQAEAEARASELLRAGHAANDRGAPDVARSKFVAAYGHSRRPSTLVSAANMALKMGDAETAAREYEEALRLL